MRAFTLCRFAGMDNGREVYGPWCPSVLFESMKASAAAWNIVHPRLKAWVERR